MEILQLPRNRKMVETYLDGHIKVQELWKELEWLGHNTMHKEPEKLLPEKAGVRMTEIGQKDW